MKVKTKTYEKTFTSAVLLAAISWSLFVEDTPWNKYVEQLGLFEKGKDKKKVFEQDKQDGKERAEEIISML